MNMQISKKEWALQIISENVNDRRADVVKAMVDKMKITVANASYYYDRVFMAKSDRIKIEGEKKVNNKSNPIKDGAIFMINAIYDDGGKRKDAIACIVEELQITPANAAYYHDRVVFG